MADYNPLGKARFPYNQEADRGEITHIDAQNTSFEYRVGRTYQELLDLLLSKHKDYGSRNIADAPGGAINGLRVRMHDKLARINNLYDSISLINEKIYSLVEENPIENIENIKELTRAVQRLYRSKGW